MPIGSYKITQFLRGMRSPFGLKKKNAKKKKTKSKKHKA